MAREIALSDYATGTLDANGNGTLRVGPRAHGVKWMPSTVSIRMTGNPPTGISTCKIYIGYNVAESNFIDGTFQVNQNSTTNITGAEVWLPNKVFAVWENGNPGADVTLTVTGTQEVP